MSLSGSKVLVTGPAGQIAYPLAGHLANDNEVWGVARFSDPSSRARVDEIGVRTVACDLAEGDFSGLPDDFDYVLHLAAYQEPGLDYDAALRVNAEATGLLLHHCRRAKAVLVMSTHSVYRPNDDPWHEFVESDPLGEANLVHSPTYSTSKIGQEAVARYCARAYDVPVVIARMNSSYGPNGGLPAFHLDAILAGEPVTTRWDPCVYMPIHEDDINEQAAALLGAATTPATIVNWGGDEAVTVQQWVAYIGELAGVEPELIVREMPGTHRGSVASAERRRAITGPCTVGWRDGIRRTFDARRGSQSGPDVGQPDPTSQEADEMSDHGLA